MMSVLKQRCVLLMIIIADIWLFSAVDAEPCRTDRSQMICRVSSDSYHENPNESLEYVTALVAEQRAESDVHIHIEIPHIQLTKEISYSSLHALTVNGNSSSSTIVDCAHSDMSAIMIEGVRNVTLKDLIIVRCGAPLKLWRSDIFYRSALMLRSCGQTYITNTVVTESRGVGLMILNHTEGKVCISWSKFTNNTFLDEDDSNHVRGGGGVYIGEFQQEYQKELSPISFEFKHCTFEQNTAYTRRYYSFNTNEFGEENTGHGQGGGMFIAFENNTYQDISVLITHCKFTRNQAFLGGGLSVKIGRGGPRLTIPKITVVIENSLVEQNGHRDTKKSNIGGGIYLSFLWINSTGCEYKLRNVNFTNNHGQLGGGAFFYSDRQNSENSSLSFDNCTFEKNTAHLGSAVDMVSGSSRSVTHSTNHATIIPVFRDCTFLENKVFVISESQDIHMQKTAAAGIGTVYASQFDVKFEGETRFENNLGTGVFVVNGVVDFSGGSATFDHNQGIRGGAISLIGTSFMIVGPNREYLFRNNTALYQGGAIFNQMIDTHDFTTSRNCFIQYTSGDSNFARYWNTSIVFHGNNAQFGKAIFTTSLNPCLFVNNNTDDRPYYVTVDVSEVFSWRGIDINESDVATEGARLKSRESKLYTIPGRRFKHGVMIKDDTHTSISEPLRTNIKGIRNGSVKLESRQSVYVRETLQLKGKPGDNANISLQTVSTRQNYITFHVEMTRCPPGFKLDENLECVCNSKEYYGLIECNNDFQSVLSPGFWIGHISDEKTGKTELATSICPRTFCNYNNTLTNTNTIASVIKLPWNHSDLERAICGERRRGILCGYCASDFTTHFHSPDFQCKPVDQTLCKLGWLFYIISELVPVTVVFITVIAFNISFTSGAANGFILFSQVLLSLNIDASGIIRFPKQKELTQGYQFIYGFLNLDFFTIDNLSFCLWPNATALPMLAFKYITIAYALSLVFMVIWFMNRCGGRCLGKCCRITTVKSSIIHGISAFLIICYSQCITVSNSLLNSAELWRRTSSNLSLSNRVWHNGNVKFFGIDHLPYALPALLCLLTIGILPPSLLVAYPLFNKIMAFFALEESKFMHVIAQSIPISKIKPLLDSFQGCFKDNLRFFAGLYFIYRWIAPIVNSVTSSLGTAYITYEIFLIAMLALHALFQPYQKRLHNTIDTLLFTNLLLINSLSCIHYYLFQSQENRHTIKEKVSNTAAVQMTLIYLPLLIVMLYLLVIGCKYAHNLCRERHGNKNRETEHPLDLRHRFIRLKAGANSISYRNVDACVNSEELPHRLTVGEVGYESYKDVDNALEMVTDSRQMQDNITY